VVGVVESWSNRFQTQHSSTPTLQYPNLLCTSSCPTVQELSAIGSWPQIAQGLQIRQNAATIDRMLNRQSEEQRANVVSLRHFNPVAAFWFVELRTTNDILEGAAILFDCPDRTDVIVVAGH
jgi:hypothetical protein